MKILLVIDLQKQYQNNKQYKKCLEFIRNNKDYFIVAVNTLSNKTLNLNNDTSYSELDFYYNEYFSKVSYSICNLHFIQAYEKWLKLAKIIDNISKPKLEFYIIGCETSASILATAFSLWDRKENFKILSDYVYSSTDNKKEYTQLLNTIRKNFKDCIV